ncbi:AAA family ATPase [Streptomyces sp. NPDC005480]|uniref:AAA family ATPase n=1 Tax=Streptomyces sp. NPDC005480 TaxID=3154880 RepID=UPI0033B2C2A7
MYLDSTNVEPQVRAALVKRARAHGRPIVALRFLPTLDTCRARNAARPANRRVPDDVLAWQHALTHEATCRPFSLRDSTPRTTPPADLVRAWPRAANFEDEIAGRLAVDETIWYSARAHYEGDDPIPASVSIYWASSTGETGEFLVPNVP